MFSEFRTIWIIITVIIPGIVFYSILQVLVDDLGIHGNFINVLFEQSEVSKAGLMIASGIVIQLGGIGIEKLGFRIVGFFRYTDDPIKEFEFDEFRKKLEESERELYVKEKSNSTTSPDTSKNAGCENGLQQQKEDIKKNKNRMLQFTWDQRYHILATKTELDSSPVELRVALFFMSINIFTAMLIQLIWILSYHFWIKTPLQNFSVTILVLSVITIASFCVTLYRFRHASSVLYEFYKSEKDKLTFQNSYYL